MNNWKPVKVTVANPPRAGGSQSPNSFKSQSALISKSWGSSPGTATIVYVGNAPVTEGADVRLELGSHYFAGICRSDTEVRGSQGQLRTLEFIDFRDYLTWDYTFCAFNKPDVRLIGGTRVKRYKHLFPANYDSFAWTYTSTPLLGWQIIGAILSFTYLINGTIGTIWNWDLTGGGQWPLGVMNYPLYDFDCIGGRRLDAALNEMGERLGVVFTHAPTSAVPYKLVWTIKGYGVLPALGNAKSNDRRAGKAISGHATNIAVHGSRNLYQVLDVPMIQDWSAAWEQFVVFENFSEDIYQRGSDPRTGIAFKATPNDPEQYIGRQLATAYALEITVRQYVALRNDGTFADTRKYAGRSRMDMPCALYIQTLLYRAFRPNIVSFVNVLGKTVPITAIDIADKLLCRVSHNAATGAMAAFVNEPVDGNGYAAVKGFQIGSELFKTVKSDQWNVDFFKDANRAWGTASFQLDDSGEGVRFIIFDEPVIVSNDLLAGVDGHAVINAAFTLTVPAVRAALVFEAEPFVFWHGTYPNVSRDRVENVANLNAEFVVKNGVFSEILYADGQTAVQKAVAVANSLLLLQFSYDEGGRKNIWDGQSDAANFGTPLVNSAHSLYDRIQVHSSATEGLFETIDYTNERSRDFFEPERELDRRTLQNSLLPGQAELRQRAEVARAIASSFKQMPYVRRLLDRLLNGTLGNEDPLQLTWFNAVPDLGPTMPIGTVIRKKPTTMTFSGNTNTVATSPDAISPQDTVFVGVTVRQDEPVDKPFKVQRTGLALARVQGPVSVDDSLGLASSATDWEYLVKDGTPSVGKAQQEITGETVTLIQVALGSGGGGGEVLPVWL